MKHFLLIFSLTLGITLCQAQGLREARILPGGEFIPFHYDPKAVSIGLEYFIFDKISIAPSYSHGLFLGESKSQTLNLDSRFYMTKGTYQWYGFTGITNNRETQWGADDIVLTNFVGANFGFGGAIMFSDRYGINPEIKHQAMREGRTVVRLSLVFVLN